MDKRDIKLIKEWLSTDSSSHTNYYCPWNIMTRETGRACKRICEEYFPRIRPGEEDEYLCPCDAYSHTHIKRKISKVIKEVEENA